MSSLPGDIRYSVRSLSAQPGFVVVVVLSLTLGIGVNTAIFSALDALILRPIALRDLDRSVIVFHASPTSADRATSFRAYEHYRARTDIFEDVMAFSGARPLSFIENDDRVQVYAEIVSASFFRMADIRLRAGRPFDDEIDRTRDPHYVAVLSHAFWQRRFASNPGVVGRPINLNGRSFIVTGIAEAGFTGLDAEVSADLWIPITTWAHLVREPARLSGDEHWMTTVGRLKDGVTIEQAQAAMAVAGQQLHESPGEQTRVRSARERSLQLVDALAIGAGAFAVGLIVLALAGTNIANLLLARAAERQREMAIRRALGASRARLIRLWVVDSVLLSVAAGSCGLLVAEWILDAAVAFRPPVLIGHPASPTLPLDFRLDLRVLLFASCLCVSTAVVIGLVAGLQGSRPRARRFAPGVNLRSGIIALQMALSLILLIPCGLFVRSSLNASSVAPGFDPDNVLLLPVSTEQAGVRVQKPAGFDQQLADRVSLLPGVEAATIMDPVPLWFGGNFAMFAVDETSPSERIGFSRIGPRYFETLRIPVLAGRGFTAADTESAPPVAIINETIARRFGRPGDALGRYLRHAGTAIQVVGIARDAKYLNLAETSRPWLYLPIAQEPTNNTTLSLAVRTSGDPMRIVPAVEREVRALIPVWPAFQFRTLDEGLKLQQALPRAGATILGSLGAFGLLLAAIGIYGVMAYVVRQRTQEIGIRLALGAPSRNVVAMIVRQGMAVCLAGGAIGIAIALVLSQWLGSVLYGISAADPVTFTAVPLVLGAVALLACYMPARHASRINVLRAVRHD